MEKRKYTVEEKKEFVMEYFKETKTLLMPRLETIARWCNERYGLEHKLHGYDFRRPEEMQKWLGLLNAALANVRLDIELMEGGRKHGKE